MPTRRVRVTTTTTLDHNQILAIVRQWFTLSLDEPPDRITVRLDQSGLGTPIIIVTHTEEKTNG